MPEVTDNFVEIDGVKYKADPEHEGEALMEDEKFVPFEEEAPEEAPEETLEEKTARETEEAEAREPRPRKSAKDYIIERKNDQIERLKKNPEPVPELDNDLDEEEVTAQGKRAIARAVEEATKPFVESTKANTDEQELKDVFAEYPEAKKMEKDIRKYMEHPAYKDVSVQFIYQGLAQMEANRQVKRNKADEEANTEITGGHSKRNTKTLPKIPDVRGMNAEAFAEEERRVEAGFRDQ